MSIEWSTNNVRKTFIDYFVSKEHKFVPSSPVVIPSDPTLLFANAGMNQFKPIFLGTVDPSSEMATYKRVVNSQKCIRAGGKHNDLDDVGRDSYHHTMFEMLGTWSFGDYFKKECIQWAWELLTEVYKLDKSRMYATYFEGDEAMGLAPDNEAKEFWEQYLPANRIIPSNAKDNFWEMGATGPCGPCSEIHYDKIGNGYGDGKVNQDDPMVIEIWNLVFIQFNREEDGSLKPLPAKHIDTGMGLERLTAILQDKKANYDIDIFQNIFTTIQQETKAPVYSFKYGADDADNIDMAYRVIADHIRTVSFALSDGVQPSNIGRGYVIRRIIRRAVRIAYEKLNAKVGFFSSLIHAVVREMSTAFPELEKNPQVIEKMILREEEQFTRTLRSGLRKFHQAIQGQGAGYVIPGEICAKLYHTHGFPFDLTQKMAEERNMVVDNDDFVAAMNKTKVNDKKQEKSQLALDVDSIADLNEDNIESTNDSAKFSLDPIKATLKAIWAGKQEQFLDFIDEDYFKDEENPKKIVGLIFDSTNFYAEQGGQVFDTGRITTDSTVFNVTDVQIYGGFIVHYGTLVQGRLEIKDVAQLEVDASRRSPIMSNHTSTHMCNFALKKVLGDHVNQQGSLVLPEKFRFDFSHDHPLKANELQELDSVVSNLINENLPVYYKDVPLDIATKINGVRQMFGEKYPNPVRVVSIGKDVEELVANPSNPEWEQYSIEFCGGTHLSKTMDARSFTIIKEDPLAKGVRRLECLTGAEAVEAIARAEAFEKDVAVVDGLSSPSAITQEVAKLITTLNELVIPYWRKVNFREYLDNQRGKAKKLATERESNLKKLGQSIATQIIAELKNSPKPYLISKVEEGFTPNLLKGIQTAVAKDVTETALLFVSFDSETKKFSIVAILPKFWVDKGQKANEWLSAALLPINGKSGGKADQAQGTFDGEADVNAVLAAAEAFASSHFV